MHRASCLQSKFRVPMDNDDWSAQPRTIIWRVHLVKDAVKEAKKLGFQVDRRKYYNCRHLHILPSCYEF